MPIDFTLKLIFSIFSRRTQGLMNNGINENEIGTDVSSYATCVENCAWIHSYKTCKKRCLNTRVIDE